MKKVSILGLVMISLMSVSCAQKRFGEGEDSKSQEEPVTSLERSGRWLEVNGQHEYLVGVDAQQVVADPRISYTRVFDVLRKYRINKVRIWIYCYWGGPRYLHPWKYSIVWQKFDLDSWNPIYWRRLRNAVAAAQQRGIVVEASIFGPNNMAPASQWSNPRWRNAWNEAFNLNGAFTANANGYFVPQFFELDYPERSSSGKTLEQYQHALVDKTINEIGSFPNVYFEVANEFPNAPKESSDAIDRLYPWELHWAQRIKTRSGHLVAAHSHQSSGPQIHGVQYFDDKPYIDILNFHFYSPDPARISSLLHPIQLKGKTLACNESFGVPENLDKATREAWGWFLSGGYYGFYTDSVELIGEKSWAPVGRRAEVLRDIAEQIPFWQMSPVDQAGKEYDSLVTGGPAEGRWQAFARPGFDYVVFFWGNHSARNVSIQLQPGDYSFRWYDPRNERVLLKGRIKGNGVTSVAAPEKASWDSHVGAVLVIQREKEQSKVRLGLDPWFAFACQQPAGSLNSCVTRSVVRS